LGGGWLWFFWGGGGVGGVGVVFWFCVGGLVFFLFCGFWGFGGGFFFLGGLGGGLVGGWGGGVGVGGLVGGGGCLFTGVSPDLFPNSALATLSWTFPSTQAKGPVSLFICCFFFPVCISVSGSHLLASFLVNTFLC